MHELAVRLARQGRMYTRARTAFYAPHRLVKTYVRKDLPLAPEAAPYLGHTGIYLSMGIASAPQHRATMDAWYDQVHVPDILETPGFLACLRLEPVGPDRAGRFLHLFLLEGEIEQAMRSLKAQVSVWRERGRLPAQPGLQTPLLRAAYEFITPLRYPFARAAG
jgi:hypothetical protein